MVAPADSAGREGAGAATRNMSAKAKVQARISCYVIALRAAGKPGRMSGAHFRPAPRVPTICRISTACFLLALQFNRRFSLSASDTRTIGEYRYPLSPRLAPLKAILAKFDPEKPRLERHSLPGLCSPTSPEQTQMSACYPIQPVLVAPVNGRDGA